MTGYAYSGESRGERMIAQAAGGACVIIDFCVRLFASGRTLTNTTNKKLPKKAAAAK